MGVGAFLLHVEIGPTETFPVFSQGKTFISYAVGNGEWKLEQDLERFLFMLMLTSLMLIS